jgi:hypothetical protein
MMEGELQELEGNVIHPWDIRLLPQNIQFKDCVFTKILNTNKSRYTNKQCLNVDVILHVTLKTYHGILVHGCCHGECFCIQVCIDSSTNQAYLHKQNFYDSDEDLTHTHPDRVHN